MIKLYEDQERAVNAILDKYQQGYKSPLLVAACGYGKTICFAHIAARARSKGNSVIICVHRQELLRQTCETLKKFDVPYGVISAKTAIDNSELIQVASVQTLYRRLQQVNRPKLIILDECHRYMATTFLSVIRYFSEAKILGVTATPCRTDGKGLKEIFDTMIIGGTAEDLISRGRLAKPIYYAPPQVANFDDVKIIAGDYAKDEISQRMNKPHITGDAIEHYKRICPNAKAVVFCTSRKHAENVAIDFQSSGIPAASIDGTLSDFDRAQRIDDLTTGKIKVLTSCELISEGFDLPTVEAAIMLRPTQSLSIWIQQAGRAMRIAPNKKFAYIIDNVGNVLRHGAIEHITEWSLDGIKANLKKEQEKIPAFSRCKQCFIVFPTHLTRCPECDGEREISKREIEIKEGELKLIEAEELKSAAKQAKSERKQANSLSALIELGKKRGYKNPKFWAEKVFYGRMKAS
jgi:superfamily II DNA or RNA helicase